MKEGWGEIGKKGYTKEKEKMTERSKTKTERLKD